MSDKWYYELEEHDSGEKVYVSVPLPIKPEKLCAFLGIEDLAKCNGEIAKEKYLAETEENTYVDRCASCGEIIPEGAHICPLCKSKAARGF